MTDAHTRQLCKEIIRDHFGPFSETLAGLLLTRGRLSFSQLVRFSGLKPRTARAAIIALIQHNVIWHAKGEGDVETFEINAGECLMRLRFGKFVWLADQLLGEAASEIVQLVLDHGKLRPPDIVANLSSTDPKKISMYNQALLKLVSASYLKPSTILSHFSPLEKSIQYEAEERRKISGYPSAKDLREAKEVALARLRREEEEAEKVGLKRKAKEQLTGRSNKKKAVDIDEVDDEVYFKVNYERFNIHIRNNIIENAARERYNEGAALVIKTAMKITEESQMKLSEPRSVAISVATLATRIPEDVRLSDTLVYDSKKVPNLTCVKDYLGMLACADNPTPEGRAAAFVSYASSKLHVEFETISRRLRRGIAEAVAREKHGPEGLRILRLLLDSGKMDDKQIAKVAMMAPKDVRPLLVAMSTDSLISMQEVPKSADRNPTRTFYLWYADLTKTFSIILGGVYKTLYNILARHRHERENGEVSAVLEKRERSDVSLDESLLTRLEREALRVWQEKEHKLTVLANRVEETIFLLRDMAEVAEAVE